MRQTKPCPTCNHLAGFFSRGKSAVTVHRLPNGAIDRVTMTEQKHGEVYYCTRCCAQLSNLSTPEPQAPQLEVVKTDFQTAENRA
jgi:hypothetical protein